MAITLPTLPTKSIKHFAFILILSTIVLACQENVEQKKEINTAQNTTTTEVASVANQRPAPEFFVIPAEMVKKRVWICEDGAADIFHVKHDCPILIQCKGKGSFRNVTLPRAIETYGRYNCQECAKELDHIFDADLVR